MNSVRLASRKSRLPVIGVIFALLISLTTSANDTRNWTRILADTDSFSRSPGVPFVIAAIDHEDSVLSALCWYRYTVGTEPVTLHGNKEADGRFWPVVTYEVAVEGKTKWKQLRADVEQSNSESIVVHPGNPIAKLSVYLEPFRKCMGIYRYGRVILETGQAAIFALDDLLPTAEAPDAGDFKDDILELDEDKIAKGFKDAWLTEPAELATLTSFGGRVIGDFIFEVRAGQGVNLEGTRTLDGDFWGKVIFQAANSDGHWKTIGESHHSGSPVMLNIPSGKAERIRVLLTDYKALIGKFQFGKILFSNGQGGVFSIDLLMAKNSGGHHDATNVSSDAEPIYGSGRAKRLASPSSVVEAGPTGRSP